MHHKLTVGQDYMLSVAEKCTHRPVIQNTDTIHIVHDGYSNR